MQGSYFTWIKSIPYEAFFEEMAWVLFNFWLRVKQEAKRRDRSTNCRERSERLRRRDRSINCCERSERLRRWDRSTNCLKLKNCRRDNLLTRKFVIESPLRRLSLRLQLLRILYHLRCGQFAGKFGVIGGPVSPTQPERQFSLETIAWCGSF